MNKYLNKTLTLPALTCLVLMIFGCSATQTKSTYSVNTDGVVQAQVENMNKDAIRLKGQIMTKRKKVADRYQYEFKVTEIIRRGSAFSTAEPTVDQVVLLYTPGVVFKKGTEVVFDAFTSPRRSEERLTLNMIVE
ncbi:hypothetical protein [Roseivirga sp. E12]|uniref:hypothetical protein n=1 Tax=Roseivirga sp. E12 TaxID=2819237 RepID=UPI001ABCBE2A|nr:hypothetical protein [Roseivirga sp. E12]MBO3699217.1 hypothetical protein [Roseivirga sp. E12]